MAHELRSPYPWFGGKSRVADLMWRAFGADVPNYVEPFLGSNGVLLRRPGGPGKIETVNDLDRYVANFWRAVTADPAAVARWADWPVNEADVHARHKWLVGQEDFRKRMHSDPDYFDAKIAGWWVWGQCLWIGGGWCALGQETNSKHPKLDGIGKGIHSLAGQRNRPDLSSMGRGIHASQLPRESGVHMPSLGNDRGIHGVSAVPCQVWFELLQQRMRRVRVACGDWRRVLSPSVLGKGLRVGGRRPCAVLLDPPYDEKLRSKKVYAEDSVGIAVQVREWALEHGDDPELRIALCGYAEEHGAHMPSTWRVAAWKGSRGYAAEKNSNRDKERIWFSPHCLPFDPQPTLFDTRKEAA